MLPYDVLTNDYHQISQFQYLASSQILLAIGMYGVFAKAGAKSKIALIPFVHWMKLGEILGHEKFGIVTACLGIIRLLMVQMVDLDPWEKTPEGATMLIIIGYGLVISTVLFSAASAIMFKWLVDCSEKSWLWVVPFIVFPGLTMVYWGMSKSVQVNV